MPDLQTLVFEPYRLDLGREQLWRGQDVIPLTNKAFAVLRYLLEHAEQLVTRDALMEAVWPGVFVSDAALTVCIHELRQALEETAQAPRFIETVRGRGYRFLAPVTAPVPTPARREPLPSSSPQAVFTEVSPTELVGREPELRQLHEHFETALQGERQIVFITGEAGIGKTALVEAFLAQIAHDERVLIGHGQCIEQYGAGEAYLPLLEALGRLCRGPGGQALVELLRQEAPSWLLQMPALLGSDAFDSLQRRDGGATQERMLRELAEAVERLTAEQPFILVLEDLHWSDSATLDWLAYVTRRRDDARLLVLGTYRPVETIVQAHPLRMVTQELKRHRQCWELLLDYLSASGVASYVRQRLGESALPQAFSQVLHQQTSGNPLFMIDMLEDMLKKGVLEKGPQGWLLRDTLDVVAMEAPESLRQLIEGQLERLSLQEQDILEAASVAGSGFSTAAVAAGIDATEEEVERCCTVLSRRQQFLRVEGVTEWTDGTVATRYGFIHALYQEVLYNRVSAGQQTRLHERIGARLERGYGAQAREIAPELAMHFVRGRDAQRASQYLLEAGEIALRRNAYQEATQHLTQGLEILTTLPHTAQRDQYELNVLIALGPALLAIKGYGAPEVARAYTRARELCQQVEDKTQLFPTLYGFWVFHFYRAEFETAHELGEEFLDLAQRQPEAAPLVVAHRLLGTIDCYRGDLTAANHHLEQARSLYDPEQHSDLIHQYAQDPGLLCYIFLAMALWLQGYPDQALTQVDEMLALARELKHPLSLAVGLFGAALIHQYRREADTVLERIEEVMAICRMQGFSFLSVAVTAIRGWALAMRGQAEAEIAQMHQGIAAALATGAQISRPYQLARLAEAHGHIGMGSEGRRLLAEALVAVDQTQGHFWEAELYRLKGELLLTDAARHQMKAEACFDQALDIARRQQAKSLELRAAMSLSLLWRQQNKSEEARCLLSEIYGWFTEGFDTKDLQEAKALLAELSG